MVTGTLLNTTLYVHSQSFCGLPSSHDDVNHYLLHPPPPLFVFHKEAIFQHALSPMKDIHAAQFPVI